jgi:GNAT superfamily N-acetyltransferase
MTLVMIHTLKYMTSVIEVQEPDAGVIRVASASVADTEAVLAMVARCSRATLYHRFHSFSDGLAYTRALMTGGPSDDTLVAWNSSSCVGLATLGRNADGIADLGVLVEDAWQRRGVGRRLVVELLALLQARGESTLHADVLGDDAFILGTLRRIGRPTVSLKLGTYSVDVDLPTGAAARSAAGVSGQSGPASHPGPMLPNRNGSRRKDHGACREAHFH